MGTCLFCGSTGKMTREHVLRKAWPDLLGEEDVAGVRGRHGWKVDSTTGRVVSWNESYRGRAFDMTIKNVCPECNNGWMNQLELDTEPFVVEMVRGNRVRLTAEETRLLERWIAKTAIVVAQMYRETFTFTTEQAHSLARGEMPESFYVWALGRPLDDAFDPRMTPVMFGRIDISNVAVTSVTFRGVCFVALHTAEPEAAELLRLLGKSLGPTLTRRRKPWWFPPRRAGIFPPLYPDYHNGILRLWDECMPEGAEIEVPEGGQRPY